MHWWKIADGESRKNHCICKQYYANGHNRVQTIAYNLLSELITAMWLPFVIYQLNFFCFFFLHIFPPLLLSGNWMRAIFYVTNFLTVDNFLTRTNKVQVFNVWIEPIQFKGSVKLSNNYKKKTNKYTDYENGLWFPALSLNSKSWPLWLCFTDLTLRTKWYTAYDWYTISCN